MMSYGSIFDDDQCLADVEGCFVGVEHHGVVAEDGGGAIVTRHHDEPHVVHWGAMRIPRRLWRSCWLGFQS